VDLYRTIRILHEERKRLERLIESLELLKANGKLPKRAAPSGRRGRKGMSADERQKVSERMKKYWAARRGNEGDSTSQAASSSTSAG